MITLSDIQVSLQVMVGGCFGMDQPVIAIVKKVHQEIKNGKPGICYNKSWAYLNQIEQVLEY